MSKIKCIDIRTIIVILMSFFAFVLGIAEAVYSSRYNQYANQCSQIWGWIVASCTINIIIPVSTCCGLSIVLSNNSEKDKNVVLEFAQIGQLIIAIWSAVAYYNISDSCYNFWTTNAPQMWTLVMIHFVMLWIMIITSCLTAITIYVMSLYEKKIHKAKVKQVNDQFEIAAKLASEEMAASNLYKVPSLYVTKSESISV